ncbi:MAG: heme-binding protein [Pseudonocardia sp.]|nr:heme-binding protein [Pseudonocardia sp.]
MSFPLSVAKEIAEATLRQGRAEEAAPLAVAVLDTGGHVQVVLREDGAGYLRVDIATAKAWGALGMGEPSRQLATRATQRPEFFTSLVEIGRGRIGLAAGGVLCTDDAGVLVGAVGVSGDTSDVDEHCAVVAIEAAGYRALTGA